MDYADVDAVIVTTGRPETGRALESVRCQTAPPARTIVVLDDPRQLKVTREMLRSDEELFVTPGGVGGAEARNIGTRAASASFVAYLDDDDEWMPEKLATQVEQGNFEFSTTSALFIPRRGGIRVVPSGPFPTEPEEVLDFMLKRPRVRYGHGVIQSSLLVVDRLLACHVEWDANLTKHQDWDFVHRICREINAPPAITPHPLTRIYQGTQGSLSKRHNWRTSYAWIESLSGEVGPKARSDFIATVVLRSALASHDVEGIATATREMRACRPSVAAILVGISGVRQGFQRGVQSSVQ